jgi:diguanylate cyclase (GGDEF)-like protein/PAS domain S-box-containing protein
MQASHHPNVNLIEARDESRRLQALRALRLLDTPPDAEIDRITQLTAECLNAPICLLTLVDEDRLWFKSRCGFDAESYPRHGSFCQHIVADRRSMLCTDLQQDLRFANHELVAGEGKTLRFYAGVPIEMDGSVIGTLCLMDHVPHDTFGDKDMARLEKFAALMCDTLMARQLRIESQIEHELFAKGPCAVLIWEPTSGGMQLSYRSQNLEQLLGHDMSLSLNEGAAFETLIWKGDRSEFRTSLRAHERSRLNQLETSFRTASGRQWLRQATYGEYDESGQLLRVRAYLSDISHQKHLEASIEGAKERLFLALESAQIGTWDMNLVTQERLVSSRTAAMLGYRADELDTSQTNWTNLIHPFDRARVEQAVQSRLGAPIDATPQRVIFSIEYRMRHKQGHYIWVQSCGKLVSRNQAGQAERVVGTIIDISDRKAIELQTQRQQDMLDIVNETQHTFMQNKSVNTACDTLFEPLLQLTDSQFGFIGIVRRAEDGKPYLQVPSISNISWDQDTRNWYERQHGSDEGMSFYNLDNLFGHVVMHDTVVCTNEPPSHSASRGSPAGHPHLDSFLGVPLRYDGQVVGMIGLGNRQDGFDQGMVQMLSPLTSTLGTMIHARQMEERRLAAEAKLLEQATHDTLTRLLNRRGFFESAEAVVTQVRRYGGPMTIAVLDLDHFKAVNDTHGHGGGDKVLVAVSQCIKESLRETDLVGRMGGEEFVLLLTETSTDDAMIGLERLRANIAALNIEHEGKSIRVSTSIGATAWRNTFESVDAWMAEADAALYLAKNEGRNCIRTGHAHGLSLAAG